ncbi:unnamed protein product [Blepharisma stoltei]|uniref:Replication protein A C-terminal domain-containing protein n=1 Tax=Blepharisma stoltei TaxID=1481888 RepID=A0AAU9JL11_9CILI|nr:unnamed protein product [Blepharisma stoltei]
MEFSPPYKPQTTESKRFTFTPVNLKLVNDMIKQGEPFKLNNELIEIIEIVCRITNYQETHNIIKFEFEDNNNCIQGIVYTKGDLTRPKALSDYTYIENGYVHIIGALRKLGDEVKCIVQSISNVNTYDQVHYHYVKVLWCYLVRNGILHTPSQAADNVMADLSSRFNNAGSSQNDYSNLNEDQAEVVRAIKENSKEYIGLDRNRIESLVKRKIKNLDEVLSDLVRYGFLFIGDDNLTYYVS